MPRRLRSSLDGYAHHVYSRGVGRGIIFLDHDDRTAFAELLAEGLRESDVELATVSLETNHFHLMPLGRVHEVSGLMKWVMGRHAQRFNDRYGRSGHLFQGRFGSIPIHGEAYKLSCFRYVTNNSVYDGIVSFEDLITHPYSAYRGLMGGESLFTLATDTVLSWFGHDPVSARRHMTEFLRLGLSEPDHDPKNQAIRLIAREACARAHMTWDDLRRGRLTAQETIVRTIVVNEVRQRMPSASDRDIARALGMSPATLNRIPRMSEAAE